MKVTHLRVNHMREPFIDVIPEFSWRIEADERDILQKSYRITVQANGKTVWDSGVRESRAQSFIGYEGALQPQTEYVWTVRVSDNRGREASASGCFETAFLSAKEWKGEWAESPFARNEVPYFTYGIENPVIRFFRNFCVQKEIGKARLYATCYGVYRPLLNGNRIDEREFAPEFTPYDKVLNYQCYDVANFLVKGDNRIEFFVGDGWYFCGQTAVVTKDKKQKPSVLFCLEIEYADGTRESICSDEDVRCKKSNILFSDLFMGEKVDRTQPEGEAYPAVLRQYPKNILRCQPMPPVKAVEHLPAKKVFISPKGETIVDFGQVIAGRARILIDEPRGAELTFEHTEVLDREGNYFSTMVARQCDTVVSDGTAFVYEPMFTFHGFRYIRVTGMTNPTADKFTAVLLSTQKENAGEFRCSDERFERLYQNIRYSQRNNMMSIPTDCPTREKAGWTGDILIYAKTAALNEDMTPFLTSWLLGLVQDQQEDGVIPIVSPLTEMYDMVARKTMADFTENKRADGLDEIVGENSFLQCGENTATGVAGWSDAVVWVPYAMYRVTGNRHILQNTYASMKKWCDWIIRTARQKRGTHLPEEIEQYLWDTGFQFGEWLVPGRQSEGFEICKESALYIASFFGYKTISMMSEVASLIDEADAEYYRLYAEKMKKAIQDGIFGYDLLPRHLQGAYVLAFAFDLVPDRSFEEYKSRLIGLVEKHGTCLQTGFLATPFLFDALEKIGRKDLAKAILWQTQSPSWLYEVEHGATTIWESWTAMDESENPQKISFDHYAFGVIDEWLCRKVCGIDTDTPGFEHILIRPDPDYGFTHMERTFICEAGEISVKWDREKLEVKIPPNRTATVFWRGQTYEIGSGAYQF